MTVNPTGKEDPPDPDAEETDVFLVLGADRRARKEEKEEKRRSTEEDSLLYRGTSLFAPEEVGAGLDALAFEPARPGTDAGDPPSREPVEEASWQEPGPSDSGPDEGEHQRSGGDGGAQEALPRHFASAATPDVDPRSDANTATAPSPDASETGTSVSEAGEQPSVPTDFPGIPEAPYASKQEPPRSVLRTEGELRAESQLDVSTTASAPEAQLQASRATGIESWIDAAGGGHTPVQGGYEQRIAAVRRIPVSPWRRAVFTVTKGRLNLG